MQEPEAQVVIDSEEVGTYVYVASLLKFLLNPCFKSFRFSRSA